MRRVLAAIVATAALAACGGEPLTAEQPSGARSESKDQGRHGSEATPEPAEADAVPRQGKAWGGWRYAGSRDDCFFVVKRRCFASEDAACKAADCGDRRCVGDGGGPVTVRCR